MISDMSTRPLRTMITRSRVIALSIPLLLAGVATACSSTTPAPATTTVFKTLVTLPTTTTEGPTTSGKPTTTTTQVTTTTTPDVKGTFKMVPSSISGSYPYPGTPGTVDAPGLSPTLVWDIQLDPGQKLSIHGPAPGTPDVELSKVTAGSFVVCPGAIAGGSCTLTPDRYTYTADVKDADGNVVATTTAFLRASA